MEHLKEPRHPGSDGWLARRLHPRWHPRASYAGGISVGESPTIEAIGALARKQGFRAILCLNTEGEPGQVLSPNVEASWAHTFELQHLRVGVDPKRPFSRSVDEFLQALATSARPVYVHSLHGHRAAALLVVHVARTERIAGQAALAKVSALGLDCGSDELRRFALAEADRCSGLAAGEPAAP